MPHSTGGGSHSSGSRSSSHSSGGGSHSGGYSSSHSSGSYSGSRSYSGSSRSSSGSSFSSTSRRTKPIVSEKRFPGSKRYVYYRDNAPHYVYSNYQPLPGREKHPGRLIFYIILVFILIQGYYEIFTEPSRLENTSDTRIVIQDGISVLEDVSGLENSLQLFLDQTGITPAVITLADESWRPYYNSLSARAYDLYVNSFDDEQHWLIVYSEPSQSETDFHDWQWEGIAGDDTEPVLTDSVADYFGNRLQKYLTDERIGVSDAIGRAFEETADEVLNQSNYDSEDIVAACIVVLFFIVLGIFRSGYLPTKSKRPKGLPPDAVPDTAKKAEKTSAEKQPVVTREFVCAYCGSVLPDGALKCPDCGASRAGKR